MRDVKKFLKRNSMILVALFILVVALSIFTNTFLTKDNLLSVVRQCSVEAVLAFGMALVLIIGCIDLSVSSVVALSGCICVYLIEISGFPTEVAVLLTLLFGAFCGLANGLIAAFTTIPAFIITLATQQVFRGAAYLMTNGKSIMCYDEKFGAIGTGNIGPIPILGIIIVICVIVTSVILNRTKFGRGMYAIGGNRNAAIYAGIKVRKITWAPCLSYSDGIYYLVYSNVKTYRNYYKDVDNFIVTSADITGPWSDPVYINSSGFDPSLFHDTDGRKYFINMVWDHRDKSNAFYGIALQEYDAENKVLIGEPEIIFKGSSIGLTEGPHIYKIGDWYYLMCAEGGTYYEHAVTIARSKNVRGPYELPEEYPLMTAKGHPELELQKCGHGCLVDTPDGNWYIAHLCGRPNGNGDRCMLGRETAIQNLTLRDDGWFELSTPDKLPRAYYEVPDDVILKEKPLEIRSEFVGKLPDEFQTLRVPLDERLMKFDTEKKSLILCGKESMESLHMQSLVGRRRMDFAFEAETKVKFTPISFQQMAGMALYYDTTNYFYLNISWDEQKGRVLSLLECDHGVHKVRSEQVELPAQDEGICLKLVVHNDKADFYWSPDGIIFEKIGDTLDATQLSDDYYDEFKNGLRFTGSFIVLCCQDTSGRYREAEFEKFVYRVLSE